MTRYLPVFVLLFIIYNLSFVIPVSAQEITPTITSSPQVNPQAASTWENFLKNLVPAQFKQIPDTLERVNCSNLPLEACSQISNKTNSTIKPQAKGGENQDIVAKAAGQYTIASGTQYSSQVTNVSTNIILDFFASIAKAIGSIFTKGEDEAQKYAGGKVPYDVAKQNFAQGAQSISGFASENLNVLGVQTGQSAMEKSLPFVQCNELPPDLCPR